jgi:hypothetical protein
MKKGSLAAAFDGSRRGSGAGALAILLTETLDATCRIHNLLLAGVEGVASRAHFDMKRLAVGRASAELVATATSYFNRYVVRVNAFFHFYFPCQSDKCAVRDFGEPTKRGLSNIQQGIAILTKSH